MQFEQLEYFIEVVKAGSINAASKKVYISQQNLNKSLHSLENELGFDILNRTHRGVSLTEEGKVFWIKKEDLFRYQCSQDLDKIFAICESRSYRDE